MNIINEIKKSKLTGRGGGCFPVYDKWKMVKTQKGNEKYVVCNASEGEPGITKDLYILENHPEIMLEGMMKAIEYLDATKGYVYMNQEYFKKLRKKLTFLIGEKPIELFCKPHKAGYVGGEETSAINTLEGKRTEPRLRPPFPPTFGFQGQPTLVNNVETFYSIGLISKGKYKNNRFISISGDCHWHGNYEFKEDATIKKILQKTRNYPNYDFFIQVGGGASGIILNSTQLDTTIQGSGSIIVYSTTKHNPIELIKSWLNFFKQESCGQCTPCREGTYRLCEIIKSKEPNWQLLSDLLENLSQTSFCGLGCAVGVPIRSYIENVLSLDKDNKIILPKSVKKFICECFR